MKQIKEILQSPPIGGSLIGVAISLVIFLFWSLPASIENNKESLYTGTIIDKKYEIIGSARRPVYVIIIQQESGKVLRVHVSPDEYYNKELGYKASYYLSPLNIMHYGN